MNHEVTKTERFAYRGDQVEVQYSDLASGWYWRLVVNSDEGQWHGSGFDLIAHHGYAAVSEYWCNHNLKPWHPFRLDYTAARLPGRLP